MQAPSRRRRRPGKLGGALRHRRKLVVAPFHPGAVVDGDVRETGFEQRKIRARGRDATAARHDRALVWIQTPYQLAQTFRWSDPAAARVFEELRTGKAACALDVYVAHRVSPIALGFEQLCVAAPFRDGEHFLFAGAQLGTHLRSELPQLRPRYVGRQLLSERLPIAEPTGQNSGIVVAVIAQHPDHACGIRHVALVIGDDERAVADTRSADRGGETFRIGYARGIRRREIVQIFGVIQMDGTGNVALRVLLAPTLGRCARRAVRSAARIDDDDVFVPQMRDQPIDVNKQIHVAMVLPVVRSKRRSASSAMNRAIASEEVAPGDGALRTCTIPSAPSKTKSSTSSPFARIACARTPDGPGRQSSGCSSGM